MDLVQLIYRTTPSVPKDEMFGFTSQVKRAVISIPCNLAEGLCRKHKKDSAQFFAIARGSGYEVETLTEIGQQLGWIAPEQGKTIQDLVSRTIQMINGLIRRYEEDDLN